MKVRALFAPLVVSVVAFAACSPAGFGRVGEASSLRVTIDTPPSDPAVILGAPGARHPISFTEPRRFKLRIEAIGPNGQTNTGFSGFVRVTSKPGTVYAMRGEGVRGRNVALENGVAEGVEVDLVAAFGDTRIWAEDMGYSPSGAGDPRCSDGEDNDGDGLVDFPTDPGCAFADDDTENVGSFATGASETIYYQYPRVADIRGVNQGGGATPFPKEQVQVDTGYDQEANHFSYSVVVTRVAPDGFYVTDIDDPRGYSSVFAYTFNPPPHMRVCDRLAALSGTAVDFFGFTELTFPAWALEEWTSCETANSEACRPCLVPEPRVLGFADLGSLRAKLSASASLVRVETKDDVEVRIAKHFGRELATRQDNGGFTFADTASNCDMNGNGRVEFDRKEEADCSNSCDADMECSEWTAFAERSDFELTLEDKASGSRVKVQGNASGAPDFDVLGARGKALRSFTGTLRYFSGGSQFTIEARCHDDVVADVTASPVPSDRACVLLRSASDNNAGAH